jgi:hypothetical protein
MSGILTSFESDQKGFRIHHVQDDIPVVRANQIEKMNGTNGFSKNRLFRKVASIPVVAVVEAERQGYDMSDRADIKKFLERNPQYRTVNKL